LAAAPRCRDLATEGDHLECDGEQEEGLFAPVREGRPSKSAKKFRTSIVRRASRFASSVAASKSRALMVTMAAALRHESVSSRFAEDSSAIAS
jgi:hypothetical protein